MVVGSSRPPEGFPRLQGDIKHRETPRGPMSPDLLLEEPLPQAQGFGPSLGTLFYPSCSELSLISETESHGLATVGCFWLVQSSTRVEQRLPRSAYLRVDPLVP